MGGISHIFARRDTNALPILPKWGHVRRDASTHLIQQFKNAILSRNLEQNMSRMHIFGGKRR